MFTKVESSSFRFCFGECESNAWTEKCLVIQHTAEAF
jgi:hypothetical protein